MNQNQTISFTCMGQDFCQEGGGGSIGHGHISCSSMEVCKGFHLRYNNRGIKHDFLCINICWAQIVVMKSEHVNQGF